MVGLVAQVARTRFKSRKAELTHVTSMAHDVYMPLEGSLVAKPLVALFAVRKRGERASEVGWKRIRANGSNRRIEFDPRCLLHKHERDQGILYGALLPRHQCSEKLAMIRTF